MPPKFRRQFAGNVVTFHVRMTDEQHEALKAEVEARGLTVSDLLRAALDDYLSKPRPKGGKAR